MFVFKLQIEIEKPKLQPDSEFMELMKKNPTLESQIFLHDACTVSAYSPAKFKNNKKKINGRRLIVFLNPDQCRDDDSSGVDGVQWNWWC